jgi:hydrogenase nickel incorporation protein HypA/HybF
MHELSIALSILDLATEEAERRGARQVYGIHLKLGPLAGVVKEALVAAYEIARESSCLADARLVIEDTPIMAYCPTCQSSKSVVSVQELCCVACGTPTPHLLSGRELEVVALEIQ